MAKAIKKLCAFRLTESAILKLLSLSSEWQCSQAEVIERLLKPDDHAPVVPRPSPPNVQPRRESGVERVQREKRERYERTAALDSVDDPSIDRSDEYVSN